MDKCNRVAAMQFRRICRYVAAVAFIIALVSETCAAAAAEPREHHMTGISDQSVTLPCVAHHTGGQLRDVTWSDEVFNDAEGKLSVIFRSENNPDRHIASNHTNNLNYRVDAQFRLTISNLNLDTDVGAYTCTSTGSNGVKHERRYFLSVMDKPKCTATVTTVKPGQTTKLSCEMPFSAMTQPTVNWFRGKDEKLDSIDDFDAGKAKMDVEVTATVDDDHRPFVCVTRLGNVTNECNVTLSVPHAVRQVQFVGSKQSYHAGEELRCVAKGNPMPRVSLSASATSNEAVNRPSEDKTPRLTERSGEGWRSIELPVAWVRKHVTVTCTASNAVDGHEATETANIAFDVTEAPREAGSRGGSAQWNASPVSTFLTSLWSLLLASWPIFVARIVC